MGRQIHRITGWLLALLLMVTFAPVFQTANASAPYSPFMISGYSTNQSAPTDSYQGTVSITGTYSAPGINPSAISVTINSVAVDAFGNLTVRNTYSPGQLAQTSTIGGNPDNGTFNFSNVQLFPGLNEVLINGKTATGAALQSSSTAYAFINYVNSPILDNFLLSDQRTPFDSSAYIKSVPGDQSQFSFSMQGYNLTSVTVTSSASSTQGSATLVQGTNTYLANGVALAPGANTITIVGKTDTTSITYTRTVVYYTDQLPFSVGFEKSSTSPDPTSVVPITYNPSGSATLGIISYSDLPNTGGTPAKQASIGGQYIADSQLTQPTSVTISVADTAAPQTVLYSAGPISLQSVPSNNNAYKLYTFSDPGNMFLNLQAGHTYTVQITSNTQAQPYAYTFTYYDANTLYYIGTTHLNGAYSAGQTQTGFAVNPNVTDNILALEQDYAVQLGNLNSSNAANYTFSADVDGLAVPSASVFYDATNNDVVVKFANDASGNTPFTQGLHQVHVFYTYGGQTKPITSFAINFLASPLIEIMNITNGQIITNPATQLNEVDAKFYNLTCTQIGQTQIALNGVSLGNFSAGATCGQSVNQTLNQAAVAGALRNGQNSLVITAQASGPNGTTIPITVNLTLYQFTASSASISVNAPIAYTLPQITPGQKMANPPTIGTPPVADPNAKFQGTTWVTTKGYLVLQAQYSSIQSFNILVNGHSILPRQPSLPNGVNSNDPNWWVSSLPQSSIGTNTSPANLLTDGAFTDATHDPSFAGDSSSWVWIGNASSPGNPLTVYVGLQLPQSGNLDVTFTADNGVKTQDVLISQQILAYSIVSPADQPHYANQNFFDVQIEAPQSSTVLINKQSTNSAQATDDQTRSVYDAVVTLKPGSNTIPFTVTTGTQTTTGQLVIVDTNQNVIGSQYLTQLGTSGTITAFNGGLTLKFPKNTVFQTTNPIGQISSSQPILLPNQNVLMGIADPGTGALQYQYSNGQEVPYDGRSLQDNFPDETGVFSALRSLGYNMIDNLYWIDPGYYDYGTATPHDGIQPFLSGEEFFTRNTDAKKLFPTSVGTLTLSYNPGLRDAAGTTICVMHYNPADPLSPWVNLGGVVNTSSHTVTVSYNDPGYYTVVYLQRTYDDIINHDWARNYMNTMLAKGIMLPAQPGASFGASLNITRAEWAQVMVKAIGLNLVYDVNHATFVDVPNGTFNTSNLWDYRYVETAARTGIVFGVGDGAFDPAGSVSREDAAVMAARAMNLKVPGDDQDPKTLAALQKMYTDATNISRYARGSVLAISQLGVMTGNPNQAAGGKTTYSFAPQGNLLRSEASAIAYRMMQKMKKLP